MDNTSLISVIVPVYNTAPYLKRCLDSLTSNTYKNLEIICVNDGSPDNSLEILEQLAAADGRIKIINKRNGGPSAARNDAMAASTGDYITFIDSDDWVHNQFFEVMLYTLKKSNADLLACSYTKTDTFDGNFTPLDPDSIEIKDEDFLTSEKMKYVTWMIYKSEIVKRYRFPLTIRIAEDTFFNSILAAGETDEGRNTVLKSIDVPFYYYYQRGDSALNVNAHSTGQLEAAKEFLDFSEKMKTDRAKAVLIERAFKAGLLYRYLEMFSGDYKQKKAEADKVLNQAAEKAKNNSEFSKKKKEFYLASVKIPAVYRAYRIATDPTMIQWEKDQKNKKK